MRKKHKRKMKMKKIMIALAAFGMAVSLHAASANWMVDLGTDQYDTWTCIVINGSDAGTLAGYLTDGKISDFNAGLATADKKTAVLDWGFAGDLFSNAADQYSVIMYDTLNAGDTFYYIAGDSTVDFQYTPPAQQNGELYWDMSSFSSSTVGTQSVPEPTSGLLMLVGLAGLALRRRRA
jgi:hypothetical protein